MTEERKNGSDLSDLLEEETIKLERRIYKIMDEMADENDWVTYSNFTSSEIEATIKLLFEKKYLEVVKSTPGIGVFFKLTENGKELYSQLKKEFGK